MNTRALTIVLLGSTLAVGAGSGEFGRFRGNPQTEWDDNGRTMHLTADFVYEDPAGEVWIAKKNSLIDGASIPRVFWSLIGGPFEGRYRNASVVHDTECQSQAHDWRAVHRMFYNGCRCGGVSLIEAKIMYAAVFHFGPRWEWKGTAPTTSEVTSNDDLLRLKVLVSRDPQIPLGSIDAMTHVQLVQTVSDAELENQRRQEMFEMRRRQTLDPFGLWHQ